MSIVHLTPSDMLGDSAASPTTIKRNTSLRMLAALAPRTFTLSKSANTSASRLPSAVDYATEICVTDTRSRRAVSERSNNSRSSTESSDSGVSDIHHLALLSSSATPKRSSWTKALFLGVRSKSSSSLNTLVPTADQAHVIEGCMPGVPGCLKGHQHILYRIREATDRHVRGLILRSQHTEADVLQMVSRHCNHVGCRRRLINASLRNLEKRVVMLNKYRDAIFFFVRNRHQDLVNQLPPKKAEADALFDMCVRNKQLCLEAANRGAHEAGTVLISVASRLEKMQRQLNETVAAVGDNSSGSQNSSSRSMSAYSVHFHGEGDTEDYIMSVVPNIPPPVRFELIRPPKMRESTCSSELKDAVASSATNDDRISSDA